MKNKERAILCILMATVFLMPLMGNSVSSRGTVTWYFNRYDNNEAWETSPINMVDDDEDTYASTTINRDVEYCNNNSYTPDHPAGTITKVEIRAKAYANSSNHELYLRPVFGGTADGANHRYLLPTIPFWSPWYDITTDPNAPLTWTWRDVESLDCDVEAVHNPTSTQPEINCSKVEVRVTYE